MARKPTIEYTDDLTGESGDVKPVQLGWDHVWYEIDLTPAHTQELYGLIQRYIRAGRPLKRIPGPRRRRTKAPKYEGMPTDTLRTIRAYVLAKHGVQLRVGRIAQRWVDLWREDGQPTISAIRSGDF